MITKFIDVTGKTEDEAVANALAKLGLDRDDVSVEILNRGKAGFLGIGSVPAKVKLTYEAPDEPEPKPEPPVAEEKPAPAPKKPEKPAPPKTERPAPRPEPPSSSSVLVCRDGQVVAAALVAMGAPAGSVGGYNPLVSQ